MKRKTLYIVILLAFVSLSSIIILQMYWVDKAYTLEEKQFNDRVIITMTSVVGQIMEINKDSSVVEPVDQVSSNFFVANVNDTLYPYLLESLLRDEFENSNLKTDFEYGIYNCFNDSIVFGSRVSFNDTLSTSTRSQNLSITNRFDKDGHYFGIFFPKKQNFLIRNMDFWIFSSVIILVVVMFFVYSIMVMLRQKRLSEVKTDFINNMTHELKTPISTIALSSEVLLNPNIVDDPQRLNRYASIIQSENDRLKEQVERVLQIASLTPDKLKISYTDLNMHDIILNALDAFEIKHESPQAISTQLSANNPIISGDSVHINNIIHNVLDNAFKYCIEDPKVAVHTSNKNKGIKIDIVDNGIGMEKNQLKMIFDKFYRVPTGNQHDVKGFGLGLYYVKTVIDSHSGKITVTSEKGKGSTFSIWFKTIEK